MERRLAANEEADGFESKAKECIQAVAALKLLDWEAIRTERFSLTPPGLFSELVRNAEVLLRKHVDEKRRREEWLNEEIEDKSEGDTDVPLTRKPDRYKLDLEEFKLKSASRPQDWQRAVHIASWVHIDEIRGLLEILT